MRSSALKLTIVRCVQLSDILQIILKLELYTRFFLHTYKIFVHEEEYSDNNFKIFFYMITTFLVLMGAKGSSVRRGPFHFFKSYLLSPVCTPERTPSFSKCPSVCQNLRQRFTTAQFGAEK
jgi:hypothetical protein